MKLTNSNIFLLKNSLKAYLVSFLLIVFFYEFELRNLTVLRIIHVIIGIIAINTSLKMNFEKRLNFNYLNNLILGFLTAFYTALFTFVSVILYLSIIDAKVWTVLNDNSSLFNNETSLGISLMFFLSVIFVSSFFLSFLVLQYWKIVKKQKFT